MAREGPQVSVGGLLGLGTVGQNSCRIIPKYGEERKGKDEGATTEEATSREREGCCDRRRKERKKTKRMCGTRKSC